jgi:hypothetical protein
LKRLIGVACCVLTACSRGPAQPDLTPEENRLVDLYVRLTVLEAERREAPDSSETLFRALEQAYDSTAVRRALDALSADPRRWEAVYDAIARRLHELEEAPDPAAARREALGDVPVGGARPRVAAPGDSAAAAP